MSSNSPREIDETLLRLKTLLITGDSSVAKSLEKMAFHIKKGLDEVLSRNYNHKNDMQDKPGSKFQP